MLMTPPPVWPNSAEKLDVWTVNSCTVSGENVTTARPRPTPVFLAPSARIDVLPARPPLMNRFMPGVGISDPRSGSSVPAAPLTFTAVNARSSTLRLFSGISTIWRSVIVWPGVPDDVLTSGRSAVTVTSSESAPTSSFTLTLVVVAVSTLTRFTTAGLKPCSSTVIRYSTGSRTGNEKVPRSDDVTWKVSPVPRLTIVTVAPGITPPLSSVTVPSIAPLFVCAATVAAQRTAAARAQNV